ncbi:hypothetical protein SFB1_191G0, partial [Candidatus Arthromitus sp. SFB-1]
FDGHNFIDLALSKGVKAIVVDSNYGSRFDFVASPSNPSVKLTALVTPVK